jgi:integrase
MVAAAIEPFSPKSRQSIERSLRAARTRRAVGNSSPRKTAEMAKRPYGAGALSIRADSNGRMSWYGQWRVGGRRVTRKLGSKREVGTRLGLTRAQAERRLQRLIDTETHAPVDERLSVGETGELLVAHLEALGRKRSTLDEYRSTLTVHLAPFFGDAPLDKVGKRQIEAFIAAKRQEGKATKSTLNYVGLLHSIFDFALRRGLCRENPVKLIEKPAREGASPDIRFLDDAELEAVLRAVPDDARGPTERALYLTAAMTGLRQGELIGLRWSDVDWPARRVRVRRNFVRGEYGTPKSKRSSRAVPLADRVAGQLDQLHQASDYSGDDDLVFAHPHTGKPIDRSKLLKRFKAALRLAGVREVRFHDLRHTFGTRMAAHGVPMRALQEMMGHRDFKTTLIYADYAPSAMESEWAEAAFGAAVTNPVTNLSGSEPN